VKLNSVRAASYDDAIPYTYEARYRYIDGGEGSSDMEVYSGYFSATICGLLRILKILEYDPHTVDLYEIYRDREVEIARDLYTLHGKWLTGNELCQSFKKIYPDHIGSGTCKFDDRNQLGVR
jgi:hypothetical protein